MVWQVVVRKYQDLVQEIFLLNQKFAGEKKADCESNQTTP
jgi:hypothetical protein